MKKIKSFVLKFSTLIICAGLFFSSSVKVYSQENIAPEEETETEEVVEEEEPKKTKEEIKAEKLQRKLEKQIAKDKEREKEDKYLGMVYLPEKKHSINTGAIILNFRGNTGTFDISAIDEKNHKIPLFSKLDSAESTSFFAKINGTSYRLNKNSAVKKELRKLNEGAQLAYNVEKKAQIVVDFAPVSSVLGIPADMVKVTVYSTNISEKPEEIFLKLVLDTILGEGSEYHFITTAGTKIETEKQFSSMKKERSVITTNGQTSVQILLDGYSILSPETVTFANINTLLSGTWIPVSITDRSFNSAAAYNNSGMAINWPVQKLKPGETESFSFYIAASANKSMPNGLAFIDSLEDPKVKSDVSVEEIEKKEVELKKPEVDFVLPPVNDYQLDPEYIQNLINRINSLQSDPETVDRQEVRMLNAELDAIMEKVKAKQ